MNEAEVVANEILNDEPYKHSISYKQLATEYLKLKKTIKHPNNQLILYGEQNKRVIRFLSGIKPILLAEGYYGLADNCDELMINFKNNDSEQSE